MLAWVFGVLESVLMAAGIFGHLWKLRASESGKKTDGFLFFTFKFFVSDCALDKGQERAIISAIQGFSACKFGEVDEGPVLKPF